MCILARSTVLLERCLCLSLIPAWAVPLGHCIQVKVFPVTPSTSPFWELQEPFGEVIWWFVTELGAWCFPSTQLYWDLPGHVCLGCPKCQGRGSYRWIYSHERRVEKVEKHKKGGHLNNLFPEWSLFSGLACLCGHSGKKLGCNKADVGQWRAVLVHLIAVPEGKHVSSYLCCPAQSTRLVTAQLKGQDVSWPWVRWVQERREPLLCHSFSKEKSRGPGAGSCFAWKGEAMESFFWDQENGERVEGWLKHPLPRAALCFVVLPAKLWSYCSTILAFTPRELLLPCKSVPGREKGFFSNDQPTTHKAQRDRPPSMCALPWAQA